MYAVVSSGGKQYRVEAGSTLEVERLALDAGASITFDRVLLVGDGDEVRVGTPLVDGATVSGTVLGEALGPKLVIFKFKQKVKYRRKNGHRQHLTRVRIDTINADDGAGSKSAKATPAKATDADATEATAPAVDAEKPKRAAKKPAAPRAAKAEKGAKAEKADEVGSADGPEAGATDDKPKARRARSARAGEEKK